MKRFIKLAERFDKFMDSGSLASVLLALLMFVALWGELLLFIAIL